MTQVLLIDDHPIVIQGCRTILQDGMACEVLEAGDVASGYRLYRRHRPDVLVVDLALQGNGLGGLDLIRRIRRDDLRTPILVLSMHGDAVIVRRALEAGATGYVLKDTAPQELMDAFESIRRGTPYLSHRLAMDVAMMGSRSRASTPVELTPRELQTLALIAEGKSYSQIADGLGVSYKTVSNTASQLKGKLGAQSLSELIRLAIAYLSASPGQQREAPVPRRVREAVIAPHGNALASQDRVRPTHHPLSTVS